MRQTLIPFLIILLASASCNYSKLEHVFDDVESYISDRPDSALAVLDSLSAGSLRGRKANARFALLYSMALDKNYIDVTDDSLINIAVDWYRRHGSADEKLKAYYYQGRVYTNAGDNEKAMRSFVKAENQITVSKDLIASGMLYMAMSNVYMDIFNTDSAFVYYNKAKDFYKKGGNPNKYAGAMLSMATCYSITGDYDKAKPYLDTVCFLWNTLDESRKNTYFQVSMDMYKYMEQYDKLSGELNRYIKECAHDSINWISVSEFYLSIGKKDSALYAIRNFEDTHDDEKNNPVYYLQLSALNDSLHNYKEALDAYKHYSYISDSINLDIATSDTKYIKERYSKELQIEQAKNAKNHDPYMYFNPYNVRYINLSCTSYVKKT